MNLELKKAIDQISKDKGLDRNMLIDTLEDAVRTSVLRRFSEDMDVEVTYNDETGDIEVYQFKIVMDDDDVANPDTQIEYSEAIKHDPSVQVDDEMGFRVKVEDLGRIAAQRMIRKDFSVTKEHGQLYEKGGILFMGTFHPAALLRSPQNKPAAFADFTALRDNIETVCKHTYHKD